MRRWSIPLLVAGLALAACSGDGAGSGGATTAPPSTATTTTSPTEPRQEAYAVGRRSMELVDASRPTAADGSRGLEAQPDRTLPVLLLYPAAGEAPDQTSPVDGAPTADGSFPLVVFSHGWKSNGPRYEGRLREWARAGYVVAAPTFPLSSGVGGILGDYPNQPADVSFVIDELTDLPADDPLADHIDPERIAAAGHSLGAMTTLAVGLNSCCEDERLDAIVELSGRRLPYPAGDFDDLDLVPFLAVHGGADPVVDVSGSDRLFEDAPGPAAYLRFPDGDHSRYLATEGPLIDTVVLAFLDDWLLDDPSGWDDVPAAVAADGGATFEEKPAR